MLLLQPTLVLLLQPMASRVVTALGDSIIHGSKAPHQEWAEEASGPGSGQEELLDTFLEVKGKCKANKDKKTVLKGTEKYPKMKAW